MAAYRLCMQSWKATQASQQVATRLPGRIKWILRQVQLADGAAQCAVASGDAIIASVKRARPPLVQSGKPGTGGTSGLHRTA